MMVVTGAACPSLLVERANSQSIKKRAAGREAGNEDSRVGQEIKVQRRP